MKLEQPRRQTPSLSTAVSTSPTGLVHPRPRVMLDASHFAQEAERRYSVRFMRTIEARLAGAHVGVELARSLALRLGTLDRTSLEREGRIVDTLLEGAHPKQALQLYELMSSLQAVVTPGGFHVAPNAEGTWTITPPAAEPYVFSDRHSHSCLLADGTRCKVLEHGLLLVGDQPLSRALAQQVAPLGTLQAAVGLNVLAILVGEAGVTPLMAGGSVAAVLASAATLVTQAPELVEAALRLMRSAGLEVPTGIAAVDRLKNGVKPLDPINSALLLSCAAVLQIATAPEGVAAELHQLLGRCGQSAAPSSKTDAGAEQAALFARLAACAAQLPEAMPAIRDSATRIRGTARAQALADARGVLLAIAQNAAWFEECYAALRRR